MFMMLKIAFNGNDDIYFQGFNVGEVENGEVFEQKVREVVEAEFEDSGYMTIYSSDNDGTPFESAEEVMDTLSFTELSQSEYDTVLKLFGKSYGHTPGFMDFN